MFSFQYKDMVKWYTKERDNDVYFDNDENLICYAVVPTSKYETYSEKILKKKGLAPLPKRQGYLDAFVKKNIDAKNIRKLKFIHDKHLYPYGMYVIIQDAHNMFFVFPSVKKAVPIKKSVFVANHLSFPYKPDDAEQVHLHYTSYIPMDTDVSVGTIYHVPERHFADGTMLPLSSYNSFFKKMHPYDKDILDLCRAHMVLAGGGKSLVPSVSKPIKKKKAVKKNNVSERLAEALLLNKIRSMYAIGFRKDSEWHFTCVFDRVEENDDDRDVFVVLDSRRFSVLEKEVVMLLGMQC